MPKRKPKSAKPKPINWSAVKVGTRRKVTIQSVLEAATAKKRGGRISRKQYKRTKAKPYRRNTEVVRETVNLRLDRLQAQVNKRRTKSKRLGPKASLAIRYRSDKEIKSVGTRNIEAGEDASVMLEDLYRAVNKYRIQGTDIVGVELQWVSKIRGKKRVTSRKKRRKNK